MLGKPSKTKFKYIHFQSDMASWIFAYKKYHFRTVCLWKMTWLWWTTHSKWPICGEVKGVEKQFWICFRFESEHPMSFLTNSSKNYQNYFRESESTNQSKTFNVALNSLKNWCKCLLIGHFPKWNWNFWILL